MNYSKVSTREPGNWSIIFAILFAGLLSGSLDILVALTHYNIKTGNNALVVLKFIASGVYGKEAFGGGNSMAAVGLGFHFIIAFAWAVFFFMLYPRIPFLEKNKIVAGLMFGVFIWIVMNLLILPMTNVPKSSFSLVPAITGALILMFAVGLPISIMAGRYYSKQNKT